MRLIDADAMLKRLEQWNTSDEIDYAFYCFAKQRIIDQPTAFDKDKVIEELEDAYSPRFNNINDAIEECIEIVKRGGIDE